MITWEWIAGATVAAFTLGSWLGIRFGVRQCDTCGSYLARFK